jgi:hypothetical protein
MFFLVFYRLSAKVCFIVLIFLLFVKIPIFQTDVIVELFYGIIKYESSTKLLCMFDWPTHVITEYIIPLYIHNIRWHALNGVFLDHDASVKWSK